MCFFPLCFTVSTSEVGVIERWGKYDRLAKAGFHVICSPMDQLAGKLSLRIQELNVRVETKTLDNVFLTAQISVQYCILAERVTEAFYELSNPHQQITSHIYDGT